MNKIQRIKNIVLMLLLSVTTTTICFSQKQYEYKGISFSHDRGWKFSPSSTSTTVSISGSRTIRYVGTFNISIDKVQAEENVNLQTLVETTATSLIDTYNEGTYKIKILYQGEVNDEKVNGNAAKSIEIHIKAGMQKMWQKIYVFKVNKYVILMTATDGCGLKEFKQGFFDEILNSIAIE
jgi:hypothetical protein